MRSICAILWGGCGAAEEVILEQKPEGREESRSAGSQGQSTQSREGLRGASGRSGWECE